MVARACAIVRRAEDYAEAVLSAQREAASAFGDDTMIVEKYVEHGRHIEVQVMADSHGTVLHLWERDCSTQRRHQKVLEEAPAPTISDAVRELVTSSAVALAREVGYTNAGTVEFLLDADTDEAYFLEMNTRLQVEHPVTEAVTGLDLVELQLRVAAGEPLPIAQADVTVTGHAIEARVYAEDSFGGFLPAGRPGVAGAVAGRRRARRPRAGERPGRQHVVRPDARQGHRARPGPRGRPAGAVAGPRRHRDPRADDQRGLPARPRRLRRVPRRDASTPPGSTTRRCRPAGSDRASRLAAWEAFLADRDGAAGPFASDGFRVAGDAAPVTIQLDEDVVLTGAPPAERPVATVDHHRVEVAHQGQRFVFERPDPMVAHGPVVGDGTLLSPMPGTVLDVRVAQGDPVEEGQVLGVIEAMKMELSLKAPFAGTVAVGRRRAGRPGGAG